MILIGKDEFVNLGVLMLVRILNFKIWIINCLFNISLGDCLDYILIDYISMSVLVLVVLVFVFVVLGNYVIG